MIKKICVITGARSEYGLLYPIMKKIEESAKLELQIVVAGMHLLPEFGYTVKEIETDGFKINAKVQMYDKNIKWTDVAKALVKGIDGMINIFEKINPNIILVLGDRTEAFAAVIAAFHIGIPIAHVSGGDVAIGGRLDESVRHAITKLSHLHFPSSKLSAKRIIKMGEESWRVHFVGSSVRDNILKQNFIPKEEFVKKFCLNPLKPIFLVIYHPVTAQLKDSKNQMRILMETIEEKGEQTILLFPNADIGGLEIIEIIKEYEEKKLSFLKIFKSLDFRTYLNLMKISDVLIGNSSSGIIESTFFNLPAIDIGIRQVGRERAKNVVHVGGGKEEIINAIDKVLSEDFKKSIEKIDNPYYLKGGAAKRIVKVLEEIKLGDKFLLKKPSFNYD